MDLLAAFRTFVRVAEAGSFSAVAREAGTTQPAVSRQVLALEEHLGVRLIQRTTRSLTLTEDGRELLGHARHVLSCVEEAEAAVGRRSTSPSGLVRLTAPANFGRLYVAPRMRRLLDRYPELQVELHLSDGVTDLIAEGMDLAIRGGTVPDSTLVARRIGASARNLVASTEYLARNGTPLRPADLARHSCIAFLRNVAPNDWTFRGPDGTTTVRIAGRFRTDSSEAMREAVLGGIGLALAPAWMFGDDLLAGGVQAVLHGWQAEQIPIHAVYPSRRNLPPRTRAVIEFLADEFRLDPALTTYGEA